VEKVIYEKESTALLVIDPYNDFISEGGSTCSLAPSRDKAKRVWITSDGH